MHIVGGGFTGPSSASWQTKDLHQAAGGTGTTTVSSTCCVIVFIWQMLSEVLCLSFYLAAKKHDSNPSFVSICPFGNHVAAEEPLKMIPDFRSVNITLNFVNSSILIKI